MADKDPKAKAEEAVKDAKAPALTDIPAKGTEKPVEASKPAEATSPPSKPVEGPKEPVKPAKEPLKAPEAVMKAMNAPTNDKIKVPEVKEVTKAPTPVQETPEPIRAPEAFKPAERKVEQPTVPEKTKTVDPVRAVNDLHTGPPAKAEQPTGASTVTSDPLEQPVRPSKESPAQAKPRNGALESEPVLTNKGSRKA